MVEYSSRRAAEFAELQSQMGMSIRDGYIAEVDRDENGQMVRVCYGIKPNGEKLIGPWQRASTVGGGTGTQQKVYEKGMPVRMMSPNNSWEQGVLLPGGESDSHPAPAHGKKVNGETAQFGKLRITMNKPKKNDSSSQSGQSSQGQSNSQSEGSYGYTIWFADEEEQLPAHQDQTGKDEGGGVSTGVGSTQMGTEQQQQKQQRKAGKSVLKFSLSEKGFAARYKEDLFVSVNEKGVKMAKYDGGKPKDWIEIDDKGVIRTSRPMVIEKPKSTADIYKDDEG